MARRVAATVLAAVLAPVFAAATSLAEPSLARLTDVATVAASVSADTLDPPTALAATGGSAPQTPG